MPVDIGQPEPASLVLEVQPLVVDPVAIDWSADGKEAAGIRGRFSNRLHLPDTGSTQVPELLCFSSDHLDESTGHRAASRIHHLAVQVVTAVGILGSYRRTMGFCMLRRVQ